MIDHLFVRVRDYSISKKFYLEVFKPLGYGLVMEFGSTQGGYGPPGKPAFWLGQDAPDKPQHIAFTAPSRAAVEEFHAAALKAGGVDNGAPGLRPEYHAHYYGAFVLDPDGNNIEAVIHRPE